MKRIPGWLLPIVLVLLLAAGLLTLVQQRLEDGDTYTQYSTFRADPFGTRALFLALGELPGRPLEVRQMFRPLRRLATDQEGKDVDLTGTTVLLLGESPQRWSAFPPRERMKAIETIARQGARVVMAFEPIKVPLVEYDFSSLLPPEASPAPAPKGKEAKGKEPEGKTKEATPAPTPATEAAPSPSVVPTPAVAPTPERNPDPGTRRKEQPEEEKPPTAQERRGVFTRPPEPVDRMGDSWGISLARVKRKPGTSRTAGSDPGEFQLEETFSTSAAKPEPDAGAGSEALPWLSLLDFELKASDTPLWKTIFTRGKRPVVLEREFGKGVLVLCGDSFFLSNESLYREHHPAALNWLVGAAAKRVVFDEHFLGTRDDPGLMSLANRYGLTGVVLGFVLLALMYVWRNASPLVPPPPDPGFDGAPPQPGLGADAGFPSLLRRAVPAASLPRFVLEQWKSATTGQDLRTAPNKERLAALENVLAAQPPKKDPAAIYREMRQLLTKKKG